MFIKTEVTQIVDVSFRADLRLFCSKLALSSRLPNMDAMLENVTWGCHSPIILGHNICSRR